MYEPYPSTGGAPAPGRRPPAPPSVRTAVKLMYAGACVSALNLILGLATMGNLTRAIRRAHPSLTVGEASTAAKAYIVVVLIAGLIGVALWLWMAWANSRGRNWARITGTVFFAVDTIGLLGLGVGAGSIVGTILQVVTWLIGLGAVVMLWRRESRAYFKPPIYY